MLLIVEGASRVQLSIIQGVVINLSLPMAVIALGRCRMSTYFSVQIGIRRLGKYAPR